MKKIMTMLLSGVAAVSFSSCVTKQSEDKDAPKGPPSATIRATGANAAYWLSSGGGEGVLRFNGMSRSFTVTNVGLGGTGLQRVSVTGKVYNLKRLGDFSGVYTGTRSGLTLLSGKMYAKLTNEKGVTIYIEGTSQGLASSAGLTSVQVTLN